MNLDLSIWKNASSKRRRIYFTIFVFIVAFVVTVIGSFIPLSHQDAQTLSNSLNQTLNTHKSNGNLAQYIFLNNFEICLVMFIPVAGPIIGLLILFDTGVALSAISAIQGYPSYIAIISLIITPVFWLEFAAYSTAMGESIWLFRRLTQRRWRELKNTGILIGICAVLLVVGALVETWLINLVG